MGVVVSHYVRGTINAAMFIHEVKSATRMHSFSRPASGERRGSAKQHPQDMVHLVIRTGVCDTWEDHRELEVRQVVLEHT